MVIAAEAFGSKEKLIRRRLILPVLLLVSVTCSGLT
jgi:hypothetical protein